MISDEELDEASKADAFTADNQELAACVRINLIDRFRHLARQDPLFAFGWAQARALVDRLDPKERSDGDG